MENKNLAQARMTKNDEFYTRYEDIEKELRAYREYNPNLFRNQTVLCPCDDPARSNFTKFFLQNFEFFGLKKLISTCRASEEEKYGAHGKISVVTRKNSLTSKAFSSAGWQYLDGDGDFRSEEIKALRDEADMIITNPPFSLYRDFVAWLVESEKNFLIIGNKNSITYKEIFPLILHGKMWAGKSSWSGGMWFEIKNTDQADKVVNGVGMKNVSSVWFTNMEHGQRHQPLSLMTMADNLKYSKHRQVRKTGYQKYDNYAAVEVPFTDAIPCDYNGVMGVPVTFLEKHCPEQFRLLGATESEGKGFSNGLWDKRSAVAQPLIHGKRVYKRIFIQPIHGNPAEPSERREEK